MLLTCCIEWNVVVCYDLNYLGVKGRMIAAPVLMQP